MVNAGSAGATAMAAVIVPTWNNSELTLRCLQSLSANTKNYVLVWIDNGSDGPERSTMTAEVGRLGIPHHSAFNPANLGFPKAINQGLTIALPKGYDPIVLLNNDVTLTPGWLDKFRAAFRAFPRVGLVGSLHTNGSQDFRRFHPGSNVPALINIKPLAIRVVRDVPFSCVAIRRAVVEKVGLLDERFSPCLGEDSDYCDRLRTTGWEMAYVLNCVTAHVHQATVSKFPNWREIQMRNKAYLAQKRADRAKGRGAP
jgi:GT2 family glycosyltransferase